jgi:catechol 2,3-dioxygenase-like lactoylglutathione lyase family enzyme
MATDIVPRRLEGFGGVNPIFRVNDINVSRDYYTRVLGFNVDFETPGLISVSRGRCSLFLCEGDQGHPGAWVWISAPDVELLVDELRAAGARIRHEPTNYPWAMEIQVEDPDGNVLRMGSEPKENEPTGEWLDMNGVRWAPQPGGGWKRVESE